jgi:immunity protein, SdpI family
LNQIRADIISFIFIGTTIAVAAVLYTSLPEYIPIHWNIRGEVDSYMRKPWGVLILPAMTVFTYMVMKVIPVISPKGYRTDRFAYVVNVFQVTLVGFMSIVAVLVMLEAYGLDVRINQLIIAGTGLLLVIFGYYMDRIKKNFFIGIRTPWTLASDTVWDQTHRLGGWLFMLGGVIIWIGVLLRLPIAGTVGIAIGILLVPVVYSYFLYRRLEGFQSDQADDDGRAD